MHALASAVIRAITPALHARNQLDVGPLVFCCQLQRHDKFVIHYLRRRLASEGIRPLGVTLSRCVCIRRVDYITYRLHCDTAKKTFRLFFIVSGIKDLKSCTNASETGNSAFPWQATRGGSNPPPPNFFEPYIFYNSTFEIYRMTIFSR